MKHIKQKFLFDKKLKTENLEGFEYLSLPDMTKEKLKKVSKDNNIILTTTKEEKLFGFIHNHNGTYIPMPLPDFTLVYYDFAYRLNVWRKDHEKDVFTKLSNLNLFSEVNGKELYYFVGHSTSCIINLFTSIESFTNHLIPEDGNYHDVKNNRTEIYNKNQIQEYLQFWDKLKKVLPYFYENKNFFTKPTATTQQIVNLKELRDKIVHTKSDTTGEARIELFKKLMKFDYDATFEAVAKFMNFYEPGYIEPCPCEQTW